MKRRFLEAMKLNLQLFAEGDGAGAGDGNGSGAGAEGGKTVDGGDKPLSFEDFLKLEGNQAEFDRRVQKAVTTAVGRANDKWKALTDDKLSEAEKLAKMSKDEQEEYLRNKERREFEAEKAAFEKEKLLVEVRKQLQEQKLPLDFAEAIANVSDAGKIKDTIAGIKKVWDAEITEAIKSKARQNPPLDGGGAAGGSNSGLSSIREMAQKNRIIKN